MIERDNICPLSNGQNVHMSIHVHSFFLFLDHAHCVAEQSLVVAVLRQRVLGAYLVTLSVEQLVAFFVFYIAA
jgi:hypothetical protein